MGAFQNADWAYCGSVIQKGGLLRICDPERGPFTDLQSERGGLLRTTGGLLRISASKGAFYGFTLLYIVIYTMGYILYLLHIECMSGATTHM